MSTPLSARPVNSTQQSASQARKKKRPHPTHEGPADSSEGKAPTNQELPFDDKGIGNGAPSAKRRKSSSDNCAPIGESLETLFGKSIFSKVLKEAGIHCTAERSLACSRPYSMPQRIEEALQEPGDADEFCENIEELFENPELRSMCLSPIADIDDLTQRRAESSNGAVGGAESYQKSSSSVSMSSVGSVAYSSYQDSLTRILLKVDISGFQQRIIDLLIDTICSEQQEMDDLDDNDGSAAQTRSDTSQLPLYKILLQHLRWLDYIGDSDALSQKLMECLEVSTFRVQRDIVLMIPEIAGDVELDSLVNFLLEKLEETPMLTVAILDALTNLHLDDSILENVSDRVILQLQSAELQDLPVVIRFLLSSAPKNNNEAKTSQILDAIRKHLSSQIESGGELLSDKVADDVASTEALFLESLRIGLRQRKDIVALYLKSRQASDCAPCVTLDVWLLATIHSYPSDRKTVESTLKSLVIARKLDIETVEHSIAGHHRALYKSFEALVAMASVLVGATSRSQVTSQYIHRCGQMIFLKLFDAFETSYHRQEIVGSLLTHIGSGSSEEIDTAIDVFVTMVDDDGLDGRAKTLAPFSAFLRCLIDYVEHLSLAQVRKIFYILCTLAEHASITNGGGNNSTGDSVSVRPDSGDAELTILLRKLLASTQSNYRAIGVVAASAMVMSICGATAERRTYTTASQTSMSSVENCGDTAASQSSSQNNLTFCGWDNKAISILQQVLKMGQESTSLQVLRELYEEMALLAEYGFSLVGSCKEGNPITQNVAFWLLSECQETLTQTFLVVKQGSHSGQGQSRKGESSSSSTSMMVGTDLCRTILGGPLVAKLWFDLDAQHGDYALNLALLQQSSDTRQRESIVLAPAIVDLIDKLLKFRGQGLEEIDMLLGCPLLMYDEDNIPGGISKQRPSVCIFACSVVWHAINWFRQIINTFTASEDEESRFKLLGRAHQLLEMENKMKFLFSLAPNFRPPVANAAAALAQLKTSSRETQRRNNMFVKPSKGHKIRKKGSKIAVNKSKKSLANKSDGPTVHSSSSDEETESSEDEKFDSTGQLSEDEGSGGNSAKASKKSKKKASSSKCKKTSQDKNSHIIRSLFVSIVEDSYRPLAPEVAQMLCFSMLKSANASKPNDTSIDGQYQLTLQPSLSLFLLKHLNSVLKKCLPKRQHRNPFAKSKRSAKDVRKKTSNCMSAKSIVSIYLKNIYVESGDGADKVSLGCTFKALRDSLSTLKNKLTDDEHPSTFFPSLRFGVDCIRIIVECQELRGTPQMARKLLEILLALCPDFELPDEEVQKHENHQFDSHDEDGDLNSLPVIGLMNTWKGITLMCSHLASSLGAYVSGLKDLELDALPFLNTIHAIAHLQKFAFSRFKAQALTADSEISSPKQMCKCSASDVLCELCLEILSDGWGDIDFTEEGGLSKLPKIKSSVLRCIINMAFEHAEDRYALTERLIGKEIVELFKSEGMKGPVSSLLTLHKQSFPCYFSQLLANLVVLTKQLDFQNGNKRALIYSLTRIASWMQSLVGLTKIESLASKSLLLCATLKNVKLIIEVLNGQMPFFRSIIQSHMEKCSKIFKSIQKSTRQVHVICTFGKNLARNMSIASLVPHTKRALETFIFKIRALFISLNMGNVFELGNLKHKNLDGSAIQMEPSDDDDDDDNDNDDDSSQSYNSASNSSRK